MSHTVSMMVGGDVNDLASRGKLSKAFVNWTRGHRRSYTQEKVHLCAERAKTLQGKFKGVFKSRYLGDNHARITFDNLPQDIVIDILFSFDSFNSLHALITSSAIAYRLFNHYSSTILTQTAKDILGDSWDEATTILVWQRNTDPNGIVSSYDAVEKDLGFEFVLRRGDIPQLVANQKFVQSCSDAFTSYKSACISRPHATNQRPVPAVPAGYNLPLKSFYSMWLLNLRFRYEPVGVFAARRPIPVDECIEHYVVSRVMFHNKRFRNFIYAPKCWDTWEKVLSRNLFAVWLKPLVVNDGNDPNPLLRQKMICHIIATIAGGMTIPADDDDHWRQYFLRVFREFEHDYPIMNLKDLFHKYRLS